MYVWLQTKKNRNECTVHMSDVNLSTQVLIGLSFSAVVFLERCIWQPRVRLSQPPTESWLTSPKYCRNINRLGWETLTRRRSARRRSQDFLWGALFSCTRCTAWLCLWKRSVVTFDAVACAILAICYRHAWKRLRSNCITCKSYVYCQIATLANSTPLLPNSTICKFSAPTPLLYTPIHIKPVVYETRAVEMGFKNLGFLGFLQENIKNSKDQILSY